MISLFDIKQFAKIILWWNDLKTKIGKIFKALSTEFFSFFVHCDKFKKKLSSETGICKCIVPTRPYLTESKPMFTSGVFLCV